MAILASVCALAATVPSPAIGDPEPPANASQALVKLTELNREAVKLAEQWHEAKDQLDARGKDREAAQAQLTETQQAAAEAAAGIEKFRTRVDEFASASFQGAQLSPVAALLTSRSPQDFLDSMLILETLSGQQRDALEGLRAAQQQAQAAQARAEEARSKAGKAEQEAGALAGELERRKSEMDRKVTEAKAQLDRLSAGDRGRLTGGGQTNYTVNDVPSGMAQQAMQKALTRQGKPYVWGATGPDTFDCSGLLYWSFKQIGVTLPRSSKDQARVGTAVSRDQLRPGDFVAFYSPVGHIGIYVGNGKMVHAPQGGDVVKVSPVNWKDVTATRRLG